MKARALASAAVLLGILGFVFLIPRASDWGEFSIEALAEARAEGKTVMIDFTADY